MVVEHKGKNNHILFHPSNVGSSACVLISIPVGEVSCCVVDMIKNGCPQKLEDVPKGTSMSAVAISLYNCILKKIGVNVVSMAKHKLGASCCNIVNNNLVMSFNTQGNATSVRKVIVDVAKNLSCSTYSHYSSYMRLLGLRPLREHHDHCLNKLIDGMKDISIFITGKVKLDKDKVIDMSERFDDNINIPSKVSGSSSPNETGKSCLHENGINVSGYEGVVVSMYVKSKVFANVSVHNKSVIVSDEKFSSDKIKDNKHITQMFDTKVMKVNDVEGQIAYVGAVLCECDGNSLKKLIKDKNNKNDYVNLVKKAL